MHCTVSDGMEFYAALCWEMGTDLTLHSMAQGPTHKKALEKAEALRRKNEALGNMRWAAENASVRVLLLHSRRHPHAMSM